MTIGIKIAAVPVFGKKAAHDARHKHDRNNEFPFRMGEFGDDAAHPIGHTGFKKAAPNHEHSNKKDQIVIDKTTKGILGTEDSCKNQDKERNDGRNRQWNLFPNKHNNNK